MDVLNFWCQIVGVVLLHYYVVTIKFKSFVIERINHSVQCVGVTEHSVHVVVQLNTTFITVTAL